MDMHTVDDADQPVNSTHQDWQSQQPTLRQAQLQQQAQLDMSSGTAAW